MYKTVIVVAVLALAFQCALAGPVEVDDVTPVDQTHENSTTSRSEEFITVELPKVTSTTPPSPSNAPSSTSNCVLFAQVFAIALVTRLAVS